MLDIILSVANEEQQKVKPDKNLKINKKSS